MWPGFPSSLAQGLAEMNSEVLGEIGSPIEAALISCHGRNPYQGHRRVLSCRLPVAVVKRDEELSICASGCACGNQLPQRLPIAAPRGSLTDHYELVKSPTRLDVEYQPASSEEYAMTHAEELGYFATSKTNLKPSCKLLTDPDLPIHDSIQQYRKELDVYKVRVNEFESKITDLRMPLGDGSMTRDGLCSTVDLGLADVFKQSQQLSYGSFGYAEPLIPPMSHPEFCFTKGNVMTMTYMVHDWKTLCQRLTPFSRTVFIDMGASLTFHSSQSTTPAVYILETYKKFGFVFDHVYAFEITKQDPSQVFKLVPASLFPNYHWINVGVESDPDAKLNPLRMLLDTFTEDDFIVIRLDIDTGWIEVPLALQLLNDDRYTKLVDQLYFEHHVFQQELAHLWKHTMQGSIKESLHLFRGLRDKGIASHYWV